MPHMSKRVNSDKEEIERLVRESGNSFHCEATNFLKKKGWSTLVSPYYMDSGTNKPREIDLIAEKHWIFKPSFGRREQRAGAIIIKLFVECKYIAQPTVFWFSDKDVVVARNWVNRNTPLSGEDNAYTEKHHYLASNPKVAKLFASKTQPSTENEAMYRALNQSLNAMVYLRRGQSIIRELTERTIPILKRVEMPVIVCDSFSNFYRVEMDRPDQPRTIDDNFQLEVNYAYMNSEGSQRTEYFLIDVVDFRKLDSFLGVIEQDKDAIFSFLG
jgi:hypothetical protein